MRFSLIIGTLNRADTLGSCLESLLKQSFTDYEIIIIDQSNDDLTEKLVDSLHSEKIIYKRVSFKGLSKARNEGLKYARGDFLCLIDDDAYYNEDYLSNALRVITEEKDKKTIVSGYIFDTVNNRDFAKYDHTRNNQSLNTIQIIRTCPSAALIIPIQVMVECGAFDEKLGVGAEYGAGEETDLLLRAIQRDYHVIYSESVKLKHPYPIPEYSTSTDNGNNKMKYYYKGIGALYKKHLLLCKEYNLVHPFLVLWTKFIIKYLLPFRYNHVRVRCEINGFVEGLKGYTLESGEIVHEDEA